MVTQEWLENEINAIEELGFTLNFKGYFVRKVDGIILTLTKRLDVEFNELYYQAYNDNGLQVHIPAYRVEDAFNVFIESLKEDLINNDITSFQKLQKHLAKKNIVLDFVEGEDGTYTVQFNGLEYIITNVSEIELENKILYLIINSYKDKI
jgi:hypothetical protein